MSEPLIARYELKYWSTPAQDGAVLAELGPLLERDPHASEEAPSYLVSSLYFDTPDFAAYEEKLEGQRLRAKLRLRRYGADLGGFAELKAKEGRRIYKWRVPLSAEELRALCEGDASPLDAARGQGSEAAARLLAELSCRELRPAAITRYEREAHRLIRDPSARLTFDRSLAGWGRDLVAAFLDPELGARPLLPLDARAPTILELKVSGPVPEHCLAALRAAGLRWSRISKYCLAVDASRRRALGPALRGR